MGKDALKEQARPLLYEQVMASVYDESVAYPKTNAPLGEGGLR